MNEPRMTKAESALIDEWMIAAEEGSSEAWREVASEMYKRYLATRDKATADDYWVLSRIARQHADACIEQYDNFGAILWLVAIVVVLLGIWAAAMFT